MKTLVVYESIFGNTHKIAEAIARGASEVSDVTLFSAQTADESAIAQADLIIAGGPTHAFTMTTPATREQAVDWTHDSKRAIALDDGVPTTGMREWVAELEDGTTAFAAFDTRITMMSHFPGAAANHIDKALRKLGMHRVVRPESFLVTSANQLVLGEEERASQWGASVASTASASFAAGPPKRQTPR